MKTKQLPQGWKEVELGEILDYEQPTNYIVESVNYNTDYPIPVLTAGKSFILGYTKEKKGIYNNLPAIIFDDFTTEIKFVNFPFKVKSSAMKILTPKTKDVDLKFVFIMMKSLKINHSTHKRYYLSRYSHIKIPLPPLPIQKTIVQILEKAESLKQRREQADKLTEEYLKSVFNEMFVGKGFEEKLLNEICDVRDGTHDSPKYQNKGYPLITSKNLKDDFIDFSEVNFISKEDFDNINKRSKVDKGDILMPMIGTIGNPLIVRETSQFAIKNVALIKFTRTNISNIYIKQLLDSDYFFKLTSSCNRGGTQKFIALKDIRNFKIPLPPLPLQEKFAQIVEKVEKIKEAQKNSKQEIDNLFNVLMQKAFRGELVK